MDPILVLVIVAVTWALYWLSGAPGRALKTSKRRLFADIRRETDPRRRKELLLTWNDLGGYHESKQALQSGLVIRMGQDARRRGQPVSANPYRNRVWGRGKQWKAGWRGVDLQVRWIEKQRRQTRKGMTTIS